MVSLVLQIVKRRLLALASKDARQGSSFELAALAWFVGDFETFRMFSHARETAVVRREFIRGRRLELVKFCEYQ